MEKIGIPTVSGMTGALKSGATGAIGGAIVGLSQKFFGTGIWGGLAGILASGSILKGTAGEVVATVLGFEIGKQIVSGGFSTGTKATTSEYTVI